MTREFRVVVRDASTATTCHAGYILVNRARERPSDFGLLRLPACARGIGGEPALDLRPIKRPMSTTVRVREDAASNGRFRPAQTSPVSEVLSAIVLVSIRIVIVSARGINSMRAYIAASPNPKLSVFEFIGFSRETMLFHVIITCYSSNPL